jgi:conjugative transfer region protein TrbK
MNTQKSNRIKYVAALALVALVAAACTIPLRGDEEQAKMLKPDGATLDPLAAKLAECRSVTYEQKVSPSAERLGRRNVANSSDRTLGPPPIVGCRKRGPLCL